MGVAQKHIYNVQKPPKTLKAQYYKEMYIFKGCRVPLNHKPVSKVDLSDKNICGRTTGIHITVLHYHISLMQEHSVFLPYISINQPFK